MMGAAPTETDPDTSRIRIHQNGTTLICLTPSVRVVGLPACQLAASDLERLDLRLARVGVHGLADFAGKVDFAVSFAVVHEMSSPMAVFLETRAALEQTGALLLVVPTC